MSNCSFLGGYEAFLENLKIYDLDIIAHPIQNKMLGFGVVSWELFLELFAGEEMEMRASYTHPWVECALLFMNNPSASSLPLLFPVCTGLEEGVVCSHCSLDHCPSSISCPQCSTQIVSWDFQQLSSEIKREDVSWQSGFK